jgi:7,8-dihydropterin-6-yl-methyl-4-(beta-D-ribofuranosyl)aminobenzene 5'-phosphate synthase
MKVDLANLDAAVVSHRHGDHTNGLRQVLALNPGLTVYVPNDEHFSGATPKVFFAHADPSLPRHMRYFDGNVPELVPHGSVLPEGCYVGVVGTREIFPGVRLVANLSPGPHFPETPELSLIVEGKRGRVLVVGCSHPGIERILASARAKEDGLRLLVGGLHLVTTPHAEVRRLALALRDEWKLGAVAPGHCTGEHAFAALRESFGERWVYAGAGVAIDAAAIP